MVALAGGLTLIEYGSRWDLGIEGLLCSSAGVRRGAAALLPSRMALLVAIDFAIAGVSLLLLDLRIRRGRLLAQTLALLALPTVFLALVGHAYGVTQRYPALRLLFVPLPTAMGLACLFVGLLFARPNRGLMGIVTSSSARSTLARRALGYAMALPVLLGWLVLEGGRRGLFDATFGLALLVLLLVVLLSGLVWRDALELDRLQVQREEARAERERAQEALRTALRGEQEARERAEDANRTKDQFLATLSHELRTPLNAILGWTRLLRDRPGDPAWLRHGLGVIERNARTQAQLVGDLLDMSRILSGKIRIDREEVDLATVVQAALEGVLPAADAKDVQVVCSFDPAGGPVEGDPVRLQQVAWNLLSNAVKFTPPGGRVEVNLECPAGSVVLTIRDTGVGIPPLFLGSIFERFIQAEGPNTRKHSGLGLGLAIARYLVEQHGGSIRADSAGEGLGASFIVTFPARAGSQPLQMPRSRPPAALADLGGLRVLVVDDEPDAREVLSQLLELRNAQVAAASSSKEALEMMQRERPDVLVSDIAMPGEDGLALIDKVRTLERSRGSLPVPAIALTAFARAEDRDRAIAAGFQLHVSKPVEPEELLAAIARLASSQPPGAARASKASAGGV